MGEPGDVLRQDGIEVDDGLMRLWAPHRMAYVAGGGAPKDPDAPTCPFCRIPGMTDVDGLVVARGEHVYGVLNLYPYNPGHLMVVPHRHIPDYTDLTAAESAEFTAFTQRALTVLRQVSSPHGFNLGINAGSAGGAGIAEHLHQHVIPRWGGDANFMPVIGHTKVLPQLLAETRALIAQAWPSGGG